MPGINNRATHERLRREYLTSLRIEMGKQELQPVPLTSDNSIDFCYVTVLPWDVPDAQLFPKTNFGKKMTTEMTIVQAADLIAKSRAYPGTQHFQSARLSTDEDIRELKNLNQTNRAATEKAEIARINRMHVRNGVLDAAVDSLA